ncbi:MAG: hypothetical protein M3Q17_01205 [Actinomycetota bacterium]|nr:hypothetical protein [Actinomycetota bacterium]
MDRRLGDGAAAPPIRTTLRRLDGRWRAALRDAITHNGWGLRLPRSRWNMARIGGLVDGLSVATLVYRNVSRDRLRTWIREAVAGSSASTPRN